MYLAEPTEWPHDAERFRRRTPAHIPEPQPFNLAGWIERFADRTRVPLWAPHTRWYTTCMRTRSRRSVTQRKDGAARRRRPVWGDGRPAPTWYVRALATHREGEPALWFGVLDNAIQALRGKLRVAGKSPSRVFLSREARRWVQSAAEEPLGTFGSICRELNLDRATVRADLLAIEFVGQTPRGTHLQLVQPSAAERAA
jgi:hypothetical protein